MSVRAIDASRHQEAAVSTTIDAGWAGALRHVHIGVGEIEIAACDYPLAFLKDADTGRFRLAALLGLARPRNLFLLNGQWLATYLPLNLVREPFRLMLGNDNRLVDAIDEAHPRFNRTDGQRLFSAGGSPTAFLDRMRGLMKTIHADMAPTTDFVEMLVAHGLVAPMALELWPGEPDDGPPERVEGLYTIDAEALRTLPDATFLQLRRAGQLAPAYQMLGSLGQLNRLQQLHNAHAMSDPALAALRHVDVELPGRIG